MPPPDLESITYAFVFRDGSVVHEATASQRGGFAVCMQLPDLESLVVLSRPDGTPIAQVVLRDDMRPIWGRLRGVSLNPNDGTQTPYMRAIVYGWQQTVKGTNVKCLTWITRQGVYVADRDLDEIAAS